MTSILLQSKNGKVGYNYENRMRDTIKIKPNSELQLNWAQFTKNLYLSEDSIFRLRISEAYPRLIPSSGDNNTLDIDVIIPKGDYTIKSLKDTMIIELEEELENTRFFMYHTSADISGGSIIRDYYSDSIGVGFNVETVEDCTSELTIDDNNKRNATYDTTNKKIYTANSIGNDAGYKSYMLSNEYYNHYNLCIKDNLYDNDDTLDKELTRSINFETNTSPDATSSGKVSIGIWSNLYGQLMKDAAEGNIWDGSTGGTGNSNDGYNNLAVWDMVNEVQMTGNELNFNDDGVLMSYITVEIDYGMDKVRVYGLDDDRSLGARRRQDVSMADYGMKLINEMSIVNFQNNIKGHIYIQKNIEIDDKYEIVVKVFEDDHENSVILCQGTDMRLGAKFFDTGTTTNGGLDVRDTALKRNMQIPFNVIMASNTDGLGFEDVTIWEADKNALVNGSNLSDANPFSIITKMLFLLDDNLSKIFNLDEFIGDLLNPNFFINYEKGAEDYIKNYCYEPLNINDEWLIGNYTIYTSLPIESFKNKTTDNSQGGYKKAIIANCPDVFSDKINSDKISEFKYSNMSEFNFTYEPKVFTSVKLNNKNEIELNDIKIELRNMTDDSIPEDIVSSSIQITLIDK